MENPCTDYLNDNEYIKHMIPHHQVGIDISKQLLKISKDPILLDLARRIIWQQEYEIEMMKHIYNKIPKNNEIKSYNNLNNYSKKTKLNYYYPNKTIPKNYYCDPNFFNPNEHKKHIDHINDISYLEHMIPHHQVAVVMSDRLLSSTNNIHMIDLATTLIREQQKEILKMNNLLENKKRFNSKLF